MPICSTEQDEIKQFVIKLVISFVPYKIKRRDDDANFRVPYSNILELPIENVDAL